MQVSHNTVRKTNIYECTIDQELATRAQQTLRVHSPGGSTFLHKLRYGRHFEIMTSYTKCGSVNRCRTILPNFTHTIWIDGAFGFKKNRPTRTTTTTISSWSKKVRFMAAKLRSTNCLRYQDEAKCLMSFEMLPWCHRSEFSICFSVRQSVQSTCKSVRRSVFNPINAGIHFRLLSPRRNETQI